MIVRLKAGWRPWRTRRAPHWERRAFEPAQPGCEFGQGATLPMLPATPTGMIGAPGIAYAGHWLPIR